MRSNILTVFFIVSFFFSSKVLPNLDYNNVSSINEDLSQSILDSSSNNLDITKRIKEVESAIKRNSKSFGVKNLKNKYLLKSEFELRIWTDQEVLLHCLILRHTSFGWNSSLTSMKFSGQKLADIENGKKELPEPMRGWDNLKKFLTEKRIRIPLTFSLKEENENFLDPDEGSIVLEIKQGENYGLVFYRLFTKNSDGKVIIDVCRQLEKEFAIEIGCR